VTIKGTAFIPQGRQIGEKALRKTQRTRPYQSGESTQAPGRMPSSLNGSLGHSHPFPSQSVLRLRVQVHRLLVEQAADISLGDVVVEMQEHHVAGHDDGRERRGQYPVLPGQGPAMPTQLPFNHGNEANARYYRIWTNLVR
jgi:hypothetical protein